MREPAGLHRIYDGPVGTFYDAQTHAPLQLELRRIDHREYRLLRRFGYRDHLYDEPFVCPHDVDEYSTDLASIPFFFQWVVPSRGTHFPAIMLHDALVVSEGDPATHLGPAVDREEADRIMRDAMGQLGVGFVRRWLAWTGAFVATAATMQPRWFWRALLAITFGTIAALGVLATVDLFDWKAPLPWMGERSTFSELIRGGIGAVVIPAALSVLWLKRWRAGLIGGITLAFLLHVTAMMAVGWLVYRLLEWATGWKYTRAESDVAADQAALIQGMRVTEQMGKGSATFTDLRIPRSTVQISVTGPGMLVSGFRLVTDLGILEGHSHPALVELGAGLASTSYCGLTGPTPTTIDVGVDRQGPTLTISAGPASMYESVVEISTVGGETLEQLLKRTIGDGTGRGFVAGLVPVPAAGNPEHAHHPPGDDVEAGAMAHGDMAHEAGPAEPTEVDDATHEELAGHGHA